MIKIDLLKDFAYRVCVVFSVIVLLSAFGFARAESPEPAAAPAAETGAPIAADPAAPAANNSAPAAADPNKPAEENTSSPLKDYSYFKLQPTIITNIEGEPPGLIQTEIEFVAPDYQSAKLIRYHQVQLKHVILAILNAKDRSVLLTSEGREQVRQEILDASNQIMVREEKKPLIVKVLFTKFVAK